MIGGDLELVLKLGSTMWLIGIFIGLLLLRATYTSMTNEQKFWRVFKFSIWFFVIGIIFGYLHNGNTTSSCKEWGRYASSC